MPTPPTTPLRLERCGLTWLVLDRPDRINAMSQEMMREIERPSASLPPSPTPVSSPSAERAGPFPLATTSSGRRRRPAPGRHRTAAAFPVVEAMGGHIDIARRRRGHHHRTAVPAIGGGYITPTWTPLVGPKRARQLSFVPGSSIDGRTTEMWGCAIYAVPAANLCDDLRRVAAEIVKIAGEVISMKKCSISRAAGIQGFRTIAPLGETNALRHDSDAVDELRDSIRQLGHRRAVQPFNERNT